MADVKVIQNTNQKSLSVKLKAFFLENIVMLIFLGICVAGILIANQSAVFFISQLLERVSRNTFLVLALIIPVIAGMGLNFSIIIGAMAGQIAIIIASNFQLGGVSGMVFVMAISVPISIVFGIMIGRLLNKTRGQEMIASMIVGFFANGLYQFLFLFLAGTLIPIANSNILLRSGIGLRNTIDLAGKAAVNANNIAPDGLKYALDNIWQMRIFNILFIFSLFAVIYYGSMWKSKELTQKFKLKEGSGLYLFLNPLLSRGNAYYRNYFIAFVLIGITSFAIHFIGLGSAQLQMVSMLRFPMVTALLIFGLALFNVIIQRTKLGQDFRTVGQDQHVAKVSGINVNRVRVIAITLSTIFAAWGQIILLQNVGVLNTFGSHMQVGLFSVAALLVGGASVTKATNQQAIIGVLLFHTLFIVSPTAGQTLFGDPQIGEFFRAFVAYGVIGLSLGLYAWKSTFKKR